MTEFAYSWWTENNVPVFDEKRRIEMGYTEFVYEDADNGLNLWAIPGEYRVAFFSGG
jgi:hypothetical protein